MGTRVMNMHRVIALGLLIVSSASFPAMAASPSEKVAPNIVYIMVDDLGWQEVLGLLHDGFESQLRLTAWN